jgi:adenylate cyclase
LWGAPTVNPDHAYAACQAALACEAALRESRLSDDYGRPLRMRIGVNSGIALVGNIGSDTRLNYTAIGDTVNIASRLESANKIYGTTIIIGEATRLAAGDRIVVRELDRIAVYGRTEGTAIFELVALAEDGAAPEWIAAYDEGLVLYRSRDFRCAMQRFRDVIGMRGQDKASSLLIERCEGFLRNAPDPHWSGTTVLEMK